jgi:hypothetical protein
VFAQFVAFGGLIFFALAGVAIATHVAATNDLSKRVRTDHQWSSFELKHGCRHATLPPAHATKYQTISTSFAATKIPILDPIVSLTTFTRVTSMEAPPTVAIRTLVKAAARFRADVVVADFKLFSVTRNLVSCVWLTDDRLNIITYNLKHSLSRL